MGKFVATRQSRLVPFFFYRFLLSLPMPSFRRFTHHHSRLGIAVLLGTGVALALPAALSLSTRLLIGWNVTVWSYLFLMGWLMLRVGHAEVRKIAEQEDHSGVAVLAIMSLAAMVSLAAIVLELAAVSEVSSRLSLSSYGLTAATVFGSWCMVGTIYTFHYARMFYRSPAGQRPIAFPENTPHPDYWDFLYFSFTIAITAQTSDLTITSRAMRKAVLAQSILCFWFNLAILGLSINIAASLIRS